MRALCFLGADFHVISNSSNGVSVASEALGASRQAVQHAAARVSAVVVRTPMVRHAALSARWQCDVWMKLECLQITGSYKIRGAFNKIAGLPPEARRRGVVAASAGNHAQGVAYAARFHAISSQSVVVMPEGASDYKFQRTARYGVKTVRHGATIEDARQWAAEQAARTGRVLVEPFDDWNVIAGAGSVALEIEEELPDVDLLIAPVGGGGLIAGLAAATTSRARWRPVRLLGVESTGAACALLALEHGRPVSLAHPPRTVADGIAVGRIGDRPFTVIRRGVRDGTLQIVAVDDEAILSCVADAGRLGLTVEPAGAAGLAALEQRTLPFLRPGLTVVVVVTGANAAGNS